MQEEMNAFRQSGLQNQWQRENNQEKARIKAIENSIPYKIEQFKKQIEYLQIQINTIRHFLSNHYKDLLEILDLEKTQNLSNSTKEFKKFHEIEIKKFKNEINNIKIKQEKLTKIITNLQ
jgi:TolA-binding protein